MAGARDAAADDTPPAEAATGDIPLLRQCARTVTSLATVTVRTQIAGNLPADGLKEARSSRRAIFSPDRRACLQATWAQAQAQTGQGPSLHARRRRSRPLRLPWQAGFDRHQQVDDQNSVVAAGSGPHGQRPGRSDAVQSQHAYCRIVAPISGRIGHASGRSGGISKVTDTKRHWSSSRSCRDQVIFSTPEDNLAAIASR